MVTVDLYPDGQAKGLGSGTYYTPANTVTDTHIAEVYNSSYQCDIYHELAHIFSYRFGDTGPAAPGLIENFAEYFEHQNMNLDDKRQAVRRQLGEGKLRPLNDLASAKQLLSHLRHCAVIPFWKQLVINDF